MCDLSNFQRGQIVGACMVGALVTKTAELFNVLGGTISQIMMAFQNQGTNQLCEL